MMSILKEMAKGAAGFVYDFRRFLRHTSTLAIDSERQRNYRVAKVYHALEKSLSFRAGRPGAGRANADRLMNLLASTDFAAGSPPLERAVGLKVLHDWRDLQGNSAPASVVEFLAVRPEPRSDTPGGAETVRAADLARGRLEAPENFFLSRRSVRDFADRSVDPEMLEQAIRLAMGSPSVCARHAWRVYHSADRAVIDQALSFQNGNRGFGQEVPLLLLVAVDLAAFHEGMERYQHWIDGGMFAMSLVWALHALGLASCCLNWSQGPRADRAFREAFAVDEAHTLITMIAVGHPRETLKVCASPRPPVARIHSPLEAKSSAVGQYAYAARREAR